jgi:hypothetical protein
MLPLHLRQVLRQGSVVLDKFTRSANTLGLGDGDPAFDEPTEYLNEYQLDMVAAELPNRTALIAVLERHGLVARVTSSGGMAFSSGPETATWRITDFGRDVHARLLEVGRILSADGD